MVNIWLVPNPVCTLLLVALMGIDLVEMNNALSLLSPQTGFSSTIKSATGCTDITFIETVALHQARTVQSSTELPSVETCNIIIYAKNKNKRNKRRQSLLYSARGVPPSTSQNELKVTGRGKNNDILATRILTLYLIGDRWVDKFTSFKMIPSF